MRLSDSKTKKTQIINPENLNSLQEFKDMPIDEVISSSSDDVIVTQKKDEIVVLSLDTGDEVAFPMPDAGPGC